MRAHIDLNDPDRFQDGVPHDWFRELRREEPLYWHPEPEGARGGYWCVTRHDDLRTGSRGATASIPRTT